MMSAGFITLKTEHGDMTINVSEIHEVSPSGQNTSIYYHQQFILVHHSYKDVISALKGTANHFYVK